MSGDYAADRLRKCRVCFESYLKQGSHSPNGCDLYYDLLELSIRGRGGVCGQLEILLRDLDKLEKGDVCLTYPQVKGWRPENGTGKNSEME